ncbi:hypothetical protein BDV18DRAFT_110799 [Aspergillus unguis]
MAASLSLLDLPREILYAIIKELDRPDKLALGLIGPYFLTILADFYELDRYRNDAEAWKSLGLPGGVCSWHDPAAYATIIRYLAKAEYGNIEDPGLDDEPMQEVTGPSLSSDFMDIDDAFQCARTADLPPSYEETDEAVDDELVELLFSEWLDKKFGILDGCVVCADCSRFIRCSRPDGSSNPAAANMLHRPRWFRHCGDCEKGYGIAPETMLT